MEMTTEQLEKYLPEIEKMTEMYLLAKMAPVTEAYFVAMHLTNSGLADKSIGDDIVLNEVNFASGEVLDALQANPANIETLEDIEMFTHDRLDDDYPSDILEGLLDHEFNQTVNIDEVIDSFRDKIVDNLIDEGLITNDDRVATISKLANVGLSFQEWGKYSGADATQDFYDRYLAQ